MRRRSLTGPSRVRVVGAPYAMAVAYLLAHCLYRERDNVELALDSYQRQFKPFVTRKQYAARRMGSWFAPHTDFGLFVRNQLTRFLSLPLASHLFLGSALRDNLKLPEFSVQAS